LIAQRNKKIIQKAVEISQLIEGYKKADKEVVSKVKNF